MATLILATNAEPSTPAAGYAQVYVDSSTGRLHTKSEAGVVRRYRATLVNTNSSSQSAAAANTYITGSRLDLPDTPAAQGTFRWRFCIQKNATGTSTPIFTVVFGTNGSTSDSARLTFTFASTTAATDSAIVEIEATVSTAGASGVLTGWCRLIKTNTGNTGFSATASAQNQMLPNVASAAFDMTVANSIIGVCVNPGTGTYTINNATAEGLAV